MDNSPEPGSLDDLILRGAVEVSSLDEDGNFLYRITEKAQEVAPEFIQSASNALYEDLRTLWVLGYVNMDIDSINPMITLTEKALDRSEVEKLDVKLIRSLAFIVKALRIK
jgi:hypothetical protein